MPKVINAKCPECGSSNIYAPEEYEGAEDYMCSDCSETFSPQEGFPEDA